MCCSLRILAVYSVNRTVSLGVALALVLEGANLTTTKRAVAIIQFYNAFEEGAFLYVCFRCSVSPWFLFLFHPLLSCHLILSFFRRTRRVGENDRKISKTGAEVCFTTTPLLWPDVCLGRKLFGSVAEWRIGRWLYSCLLFVNFK